MSDPHLLTVPGESASAGWRPLLSSVWDASAASLTHAFDAALTRVKCDPDGATAAFVADVHVGNHAFGAGLTIAGLNVRARLALVTLLDALYQAVVAGASAFVVLGDLLDTVSADPRLLAAVGSAFSTLERRCFMPVYLLLGNHESVSSARDDHALGVFAHIKGVHVIAGGPMDVLLPGSDERRAPRLHLVPFMPAISTAEYLDRWAPLSTTDYVLGLHVGLYDNAMLQASPWVAHSGALHVGAIAKLQRRVRSALTTLAGDWHRFASWAWGRDHMLEPLLQPQVREPLLQPQVLGDSSLSPACIQVGSLCPTGWDNPGLNGYGSLVLVTVRHSAPALVRRVALGGPRFLRVSSAAELAEAMRQRDDMLVSAAASPTELAEYLPVFVQWTCGSPDEVEEARRALAGAEYVAGAVIRGSRVVLDRSAARAQAAAAVTAVQSASTLEQAVADYVRSRAGVPTPLQERVINEALGCLHPGGVGSP